MLIGFQNFIIVYLIRFNNMISKLVNFFRPNYYPDNISYIKTRKHKQFDLIQQKNIVQDPKVLQATIQQLKNIPDSIYTFALRAKKLQHFNAVADLNIEKALQQPNSIPFSVKNQLKVQGMIPTCGYASNAQETKIANENSLVVDILQKQGMIAYIQSNVPQGLWGIQSNNHMFGTSLNPYDTRFTSGGSSGGEAVLVRMCCSAFGVGSDMAGSVRIPASFCGIYSFKPTGSRRLSKKGRLSLTGSEIQIVKDVDPTLGFMTKCVDDLQYLLSITLGKGTSKDWSVHGDWQQTKYKQSINKSMTIGYIINSAQVETAPSIQQAITSTIKKLQEQGHKIVKFQFDELTKFRDNINRINSTPGIYKTILSQLKGESILPHNMEMAVLQTLGNWALKIRSMLSKEPEMKKIYENLKSISLMEFFGVIAQNQILKEKFIKKWEQNQLDILISPVTPFTALLKGQSKYLVNQLTFCCFQNILEMPAGVVPICLAKDKKSYPQYSDTRFYGKLMKQSIDKSEGLPVCIQITAKPFHDQLCLAAMKNIQSLIGHIPLPKNFDL